MALTGGCRASKRRSGPSGNPTISHLFPQDEAGCGLAGEGVMAKADTSGGIRAIEMWLLPFAAMFTRPTWLNALALVSGALLCLNRCTVCAALRAMDGAADKGFSRFHRFLSCAQWSGLQGVKILLP